MKYAFEDRRVICKGDYYIAPNSAVIGSVILEHNASIWFNCVLRADNDTITIGEGSQIQDGCVLHADPGAPILLERNVSVGHMAMLHGCTIGEGSLIGMHSTILNWARIGKNCLIGAGTLIPENKVIPDGVLVLGAPGKVIRPLEPHEIDRIHQTSENYRQRAKRYQTGLKADGS